ncbi:Vps62-related protein [Embleya scabrispora]|uniref:Vps62-related protein n=1 Tax=Embleya scabrispora TaxID=159449 RepID=UPI0004774817|nr:Vps62-related protein [Embleya scabrispora]MYS79600.1 Vps62-related protein [Streptomyces sp. SID5474]
MIVQRYGDLEIGYSLSWVGSGNWAGGPPSPAARINTSFPWRVFGDVLSTQHPVSEWRTRGLAGLMVSDRSARNTLLAHPVDFVIVGTDAVGRRVWRPIPPDGFVALGDVVTYANGRPAPSQYVCVRRTHNGRDYVRRAELGPRPILQLAEGRALWPITPPRLPDDDIAERLILPTGTFSCGPATAHGPTDVTWVLDLPAAVERAVVDTDLRLESHSPPPPRTVVTDRTVVVPYVMVTDNGRTESWKVENSPFYRVHRRRRFDLVRHVDFRGQGSGQIAEEIEQGVSNDRSTEFSRTTGVTVGVSVGVEVSATPFGIGTSVNMETSVSQSVELGYASRYGVTTFDHRRVRVAYDVPAGHSGALWSDRHELVPVRGDGTLITNANLGLNSGNYVGRTFPHSAGNPVMVRTLSAEETATTHTPETDPETPAPTETDTTRTPQ